MTARRALVRSCTLVAALGLAASLACGCSCGSSSVVFPDAPFSFDASRDTRVVPPDATLCDTVTGHGCACGTVGETRTCDTGGVGACGMGVQVCEVDFEFSSWGACGGAPDASPESCNGIDDDCDGTTDEGLGDLTCGDGACATSTSACASGVPQTCVPLPVRGEECNLVDDDCDLSTDEDLGSTTCGVGACQVTVAGCTDGVPGVCTPLVANVETCDGTDEDCDGEIDELLGNVSCGVGECLRTVPACDAGAPAACVMGAPATELCNGLDDDCDGTIDDGFGTTVCGIGECRRIVLDCAGGGGGACAPGMPVAEVCNGLDDDCDGTADDGIAAVTCGVGACSRTQAACVGGVPASCTPGMPAGEACNGIDDDCDGMIDDGLAALTCGLGVCRRTVPACTGGAPSTCTSGTPAASETCGNALDDDCNGAVDDLCGCDPGIDRDFDGFNECTDCDDANGAVSPGRTEACNGLDDDCDLRIDETFDSDRDGFGTCSTNPFVRDCNDAVATVYPGAPELCGADGTGDGVDQDCDGYTDELCTPCDSVDRDGDGVSECAGDCNDMDVNVFPRAAEVCDNFDNDCNTFTVANCGVSEACRWTSGMTNVTSGADVCGDDLLCGCVVSGGGTCSGDYICSSFCEGSYTGALGAGCTATQTCFYRVTLTDNQHGCAETTDTVGTLGGGAVCTADTMCRSGNCDRFCIGPGCTTQRCVDYCSHHDPGAPGSCAAGTVCEIQQVTFMTPAMLARCALDDNGTGDTGSACGAGRGSCLWGAPSCVGGVCAEPCALESHCSSGYHCSIRGNATTVGNYAAAEPIVGGMTAIETVPVCLADTGTGLHNRQGGAACTQNGDCASQFCESTTRTCIDLCTSDASCPTGLGCELAYVRAPTGVVSARVCLSGPPTGIVSSL